MGGRNSEQGQELNQKLHLLNTFEFALLQQSFYLQLCAFLNQLHLCLNVGTKLIWKPNVTV